MRKEIYLSRKKVVRFITPTIAFIVAIVLISSSSISITLKNTSEITNYNSEDNVEETQDDVGSLTGLAPNVAENKPVLSKSSSSDKGTGNIPCISEVPLPFGETMYGYCTALCPHGEGPCKWDSEEPGDVEQLSNNVLPNFAAGGTWTLDQTWLVCEYSNGALYEIDPETGDIEYIGGGGVGLNGLCIDPTTNTFYGCSNSDLYKIDPEDGSQEYIGPFNTGQTHVAITCGPDGEMYSWDIKFSGDSYLYEVDLETGEATQLFSLGKTLTYAQDGDWCRLEDLLYLTAYISAPESGGYLCTVDVGAEELEIVGQFENSAEITGSMFKNYHKCCEHDVGVKSIDKPVDGYAGENLDIEVTVKNYGRNNETTDVQFEILNFEDYTLLLYENFSGKFPPTGWETDHWRQSYTGDDPPEAHLNKYYQYPNSTSYIRTQPVNATGFEKIKVKFRLYADFYYPQYTYFYLQYRKNDTSAWRDVTPWDNPPLEDLGPEWYEIGCYGWGEDLGDEFQFQWYLDCYYYYFNDIYLDDVYIYGGTGYAEYAELAEDVDVPLDEEVKVEFEKWTPNKWQNPEYEDKWVEYPLTAFTLLQDNNTRNDKKQKPLSLYFPFFHDVGVYEFYGPESGPAQTFPVNATIKNFGQYKECCFKTYVEIAEIDLGTSKEIFTENFPTCSPWPPTGWTRTHTNWNCSNSNYAGGTSPEAKFYYKPISYPDELCFASPDIDTWDYGAVEIEFKSRNTYSYGTYDMTVETSTDGVTWDEVWATSGTHGPETVKIITGKNVGGSNFYIAFTVKTKSYSILYWSVDDIVIRGFPMYDAEYEDQYCIDKIKAGETWEIEFDDWTPDYLQYEKTGSKSYSARVWTELNEPKDNNPDNDLIVKFIELDFFHDVGIRKMDSPRLISGQRKFYAVDCSGYPSNSRMIWFDPQYPGKFHDIGKWPNSNFPQSATFVCDKELWFCDTYGNIFKKTDPLSEEYISVGSSGTGELVGLSYHEKTKVLYGMSTKNLYTIDMDTGKGTLVGSMGNSGLMISLDCDEWSGIMYSVELGFGTGYTYTIDLETGKATQLGQTGVSMNYGQDMAYDCVNKTMYICAFNYGTFRGELYSVNLETGAFTFIGILEDGAQVSAFAIPGCCFGPSAYVPIGNQDIIAIAENIGTFPEKDMTCTAEINEYITDCDNGTLVYEDFIEDIDIITPLVGEETLTFDDYNFAAEGFYGIFVNLTDDNDDNLKNNFLAWGVGCDATHPDSSYTLDPPEPDGLNGWYVSDLEVTICAEDPEIGCGHPGSGIKEIMVSINNGGWQSYSDDCVTIIISDDGVNNIRFYAIDNVGNEEPIGEFSFKMDQTQPVITLKYEVIGGNPLQGWDILFTAEAIDATSGMERVEMYINEGLVETIKGPGPLFEFVIEWSRVMKDCIFKFVAFDMAGNSAYSILEDVKTKSNSKEQFSTHLLHNMWILEFLNQFSFLKEILTNFLGGV